MQSESQNIEYKETWNDKYLQWICGFANAQGGRIYIGVNDDKEVVGLNDAKKLMEDIPNKIANSLGIVADVNLLEKNEKEYIEIVVSSSTMPISCHGVYHYRSGSTKQELRGAALQQFIMRKMGHSWDDMPLPNATIAEIDRASIDYFLRNGILKKRIAESEKETSTEDVLKNLRLIGEDGYLRSAAILLFGKEPQRRFAGVQFKIGRFGASESDLIIQDVIEGNVIRMVDTVVSVLKSKYLYSPIHYEGMIRMEPLEIPEDGLREILYNSVCHKDYMGAPIQMQVYTDHIEIWNEGGLPEGYTAETLMRKHSSRPRNKTIASTMFMAGFIETWGRGYTKIRECFEKEDYPMPIVKEIDGGVSVWIKRFSLEELVARNKKRYGKNAPNLRTIKNEGFGENSQKFGENEGNPTEGFGENGQGFGENEENPMEGFGENDKGFGENEGISMEGFGENGQGFGENEGNSMKGFGENDKGFGEDEENLAEGFGNEEQEFGNEEGTDGEKTIEEDENSSIEQNTAVQIVNLIRDNCRITASELSAQIGVSKRTIEKHIKHLREKGIIVREGSMRKSVWHVLENLDK